MEPIDELTVCLGLRLLAANGGSICSRFPRSIAVCLSARLGK